MLMSRNSVQPTLGPMELKALSSHVETAHNSLSDWRIIIGRALGKSGLSQKRAASELGITEGQFSRQLAGVEHLSFWRMRNLPPEFWRELIVLIAEFHHITIGGTQQDAEDARVGALVREVVQRCR